MDRLRVRQCRHLLRDAVERRLLGALPLVALDLVPGRLDLPRVLCRAVSEDVGMAPDQLPDHRAVHLLPAKLAGVDGQLHLEDDVEQHVPELLDELVAVVSFDGIYQLVALFDDVALHRIVRLLAVPRASIGASQAFN